MSAPVPKPRTKFAETASPNSLSPNSNQNGSENGHSPMPPTESNIDVLRKPQEVDELNTVPTSPSPPAVPPRPPAKPPRSVINQSAAQSFGNVLGELRVNLGETKPPPPPEIGFIVDTPSDPSPISPPSRIAPPPPRPPLPAGWKPEIGQKPLIPERSSSHTNRPLPAIPIEDVSAPSSSSYYNTIENPVYLSLDTYRSVSGITPSPTPPIPSTDSPDCDQIREWLTEEEESEPYRPDDLDLNSTIASETSRNSAQTHEDHEENPYTPCPRRSDYSSSEFIGSTTDPFDDSFFSTTSSPPHHHSFSSSGKTQNLYVSPQELFERKPTTSSDDYENVVVACAPEDVTTSKTSPLPHTYVNLSATADRSSRISSGDSEAGCLRAGTKMKIDGSSITFVGFVCLTSTKKEKRVHCRLRNMQLSFHEDEESTEATQGPFDIKDIYLFRQIRREGGHDGASTSARPPMPAASILLHIGEKKQHVVSFVPEDPANLWMFFISEAWLSLHYGLTTALRDADELSICGVVWIKHGSTGQWTSCSVGINNLTLYYMFAETRDRITRNSAADELIDVDLRKVMTMRDRIDKTEFCPMVKHKRGPFSMTLNGITLYIDSRDDATTSSWYDAIDTLLKRPATRLEQFRLTGDNIPVIVDKCIRFVSAYGMKSEGIYRRNGKVTEAKTILTKLTEDPVGYYPVQENDETVYAVADVLRQFFRRLDEPLFPSSVQADLFDLATESQSDALWNRYAEVIEQLPAVHHATLKKLVGHLHDVAEHATENRASIENLGKVFGASLFLTDSMDEKVFSETYSEQINTMIHLISGYDTIFQISMEEELSRQIVNDAEKKSLHAKKQCSDMIVAIHVWEKENRPFNVNMSLASEEVCREAVAKRGFDGPPESSYAVFECICDGQLLRRLPVAEKMSKCVLQWIDWQCKDGYLLFNHDKHRFDGDDMSCFTGKVKVAEPGSKTFKSYEVKIENGTSVVAFRNEKPWKTWQLDNVIWYIGAETSRKTPNVFNATMISTSKDGFASRFPGFCFSFKEEVERTRWMTALNNFTKGSDSEKLVYF